MREFKFKVWDTKYKEFSNWTNRDPFFDMSKGALFFWERQRREDGTYAGDIVLEDTGNRFVILQYTGLKDKNDEEVYEGDIVKYARTRIERVETSNKVFTSNLIELGEDIGEIVWYPFEFCVSFDYKRYDDIERLVNAPHRFEVIGNIFENSDLLKQ
jgi:uncharacterized phage protein (TIGR01671 family)